MKRNFLRQLLAFKDAQLLQTLIFSVISIDLLRKN
jgi:hypothetical protein